MYFERVATFLVCSTIDPTCNDDTETVAEIVVSSEDGNTLVYSDSATGSVGFVDLKDPAEPVAIRVVAVGGETTSVAVAGTMVLAAVNTSPDFVNPSGKLVILDMQTGDVLTEHELGGQPDAVAVSPDGKYAAIAIENERDEDLGEGILPQLPAGYLVIVSLADIYSAEAVLKVPLTGLDGLMFPEDPEPEYVAINDNNIAVVTFQENNGIALIDLEAGAVVKSFSAGTFDLNGVDTAEEGIIDQSSTLAAVPREPDGVAWIGNEYFATADEGDMNGGSRSFTIFTTAGDVVSTTAVDQLTASFGHYPEERSENKGSEPENVFYGQFGGEQLLFINVERASVTLVYDVKDPAQPIFKQVLPAGVGPEGGTAITSRGLAVVASEKDDRGDKMRSGLSIYQMVEADIPAYPTLVTAGSRPDGSPIPWSAMSGLVCAQGPLGNKLYAIEDSFYKASRIFAIDASSMPAKLTGEMRLIDAKGALSSVAAQGEFDAEDLQALVNSDLTVNIDPEGIAAHGKSLFVASEGRGTVGDASRPVESLNMILKVDGVSGVIEEVILLPEEVNAMQLRFGFEGVAVDGDSMVVAFQRAWGEEANPRLGLYNLATKSWQFVYYPLDEPASQNGGWVGLSDITPLGNGKYAVLERDNQGGPDAAIKKVYTIDLSAAAPGETVAKVLAADLMPLLAAKGGLIYEKVEGLARCPDGAMFVINDNDGVDDNSGETQLLQLGGVW